MEPIKELRGICQKPVLKDSNKVMNITCRPFSIYITKICLLLGITPNQVTLFFDFLMIVTGVLFMFGRYWHTLIGVLVLYFTFILDCVDGEIARYIKKSSIKGKYLDNVLHYVIYPFVIFGLSFGAYQRLGEVYILVFGFFAGVFYLLIDIPRIARYETLFELAMKPKSARVGENVIEKKISADKKSSLIKKLFYIFNISFKITTFLFVVLIGAIFDIIYLHLGLIIVYATVLPLVTFARIYYEYKQGLDRFMPYLKFKK